jgi:salicylate synthetase
MLGTYLQARPEQTPSRSYLVKFMEREVMGFSPELIVAVKDQIVSTEPVAGTRALKTSDSDNAVLRKDLQSDPKEIVEHAISVREAFREMEEFSENVSVDEFMSTLERGSVQHIASEVTGTLKNDKDAWDAFDVLFPSITASGIPKTNSIKAILRIEEQSRGLYSGAILMLSEQEFEASLVLRSAFQEPGKSWIQAGCGMVGLSTPEREFTETIEKFAGIAPYVVCET